MGLQKLVKEGAERHFGSIKSTREHLHAHPELSFQEHQTAAYIEQYLLSIGIQSKRMANTGVVAVIKGLKQESNAVIALRADIDALPIQEENDRPYKSKHAGVMHACGHDVHAASLLGVATILNEIKHEWSGTVKLIFQPGEEVLPGGASLMIKEGVLKNPDPTAIIGQHVMPLLPAGTVGFRSGLYMASTDEIYLTIKGKGGHAAMPQMLVDPVYIGSQIIVALQQVISRMNHPATPSVLSFGRFIANGATNIIPNEVNIAGTLRTLNEEWRKEAKQKITQIVEGMAASMGAKAEINIKHGYPYLHNNPELTQHCKQMAIQYLGADKVVDLDIWMAAEDFAFYSQEIPACFYRLGVKNESRGITSSVHTPTFDIDESALETGAGLMAWLALKQLGN